MLLSVVYTLPTLPTTSSARIDALSGPAFESTLVEDAPENATILNMTNPAASVFSPLDERYLEEGPRPLNVLVFADEEARGEQHWIPSHYGLGSHLDWKDYAVWQIERGDETLVAEFGIDIRVIATLTWDSDDSKKKFPRLTDELWYEKGVPYLRGEYNGIWIDAIIGVTAQNTPQDDKYGQALSLLGVVLLRWEAYWADDNLLQHEVSHLFKAVDVVDEWSVMSYDVRYDIFFVEEDGYLWWIWNPEDGVPVGFLTNDYDSYNYAKINVNKDRYPIPLGDADLDGDVDADDYDYWYENCGVLPKQWSPAFKVDPDFDNNGAVDLTDLGIWIDNFMVHDVAVINVVLVFPYGATAVYPGWVINVLVTVRNEGDYSETFTVRARAEALSIGIQTVSNLAPGDTKTLTFIWDTTGISPGNAGLDYTISAKASVVPDETDTADNTYVDGTVRVKYPGDVDGDGDVDRYDYGTFSVAYGSQYGDPNYDWRCDFDGDGDIDRYDYGILAQNYGS